MVRLVGGSSSAALKGQLVTALAYMLRHATHLNQAFAQGELCAALTAAVGSKSGKLSARAVAALGELLFYFSIRLRQQHDASFKASGATPSGEWASCVCAKQLEHLQVIAAKCCQLSYFVTKSNAYHCIVMLICMLLLIAVH